MKNFTFLLIFFVSLIFQNCRISNEKKVMKKVETEFVKSFTQLAHTEPLQSAVYMVIPRAGCSGCISTAEAYMIEFLSDSLPRYPLHFVLTNFDSEKIIRARFGSYIKENTDKVYIDREDLFTKDLSLKSMYPVIYFFDNDRNLSKVSEVSPTSDGIADIRSHFETKKQNL